jgi:DNA-directed RNA polymerase sigma subunit (sigma70/sigma32)
MTAKETAAHLERAVAAAITARETCDPADRPERARLDRELLAAQDALAVQFVPLAHKVATALTKRYPLIDRDELADECVLGVVKASRKWEPGRGNSFQTHAWNGALYAGLSWGGKATHRGFTGLSNSPTFSPGVVATGGDGDQLPLTEVLLAPEPPRPDDRLDDLPGLVAVLDDRLRDVVLWRCEGRKLGEIGERLGVTRSRAQQLEAKAIRELRALAGVG